ncbi:Branch domain-containing protein, partial [Cephalotus follicularis]
FEMSHKFTIEVISDRTYCKLFQIFCKSSCYGDEHCLPTFVTMKFWNQNSNRSLKWVDRSRGGPHLARSDANVEATVCMYNGSITDICYLYARKLLPNAFRDVF